MNINLCASCGWIGTYYELVPYKGDIEISPELQTIIERNKLSAKACPLCFSTLIFSKNNSDNIIQWTPNMHSRMQLPISESTIDNKYENKADNAPIELQPTTQNDHDIDMDIVSDIISQAQTEEQKLKSVIDFANGLSMEAKQKISKASNIPVDKLKDSPVKRKKAKVKREPPVKDNMKCEDCGKEFHSKVKQTRCYDCNQAFMKKFVG